MRYFLYLVALITLLYPVWGLVAPQSYLNELIETYPLATQASSEQVRIAALQMFISSSVLALAIFSIAKFIQHPLQYYRAKYGAILFICYPFALSLVQGLNSSILYKGVENAHIVIEFSTVKLFYIVFGIIILGISRSQQHHNGLPSKL